MIVVDTSVWVDGLRGREPTASRLAGLLDRDDVALAVPVRIELLSGARRTERARLRRVLSALPLLVPSDDTWTTIEEWVATGAAAGHRFGLGDLLIAAIASEHACSVWSLDHDFTRLAQLGLVSEYAGRG